MSLRIGMIALSALALAAGSVADTLEDTFLHPTPQARELLGPLFWLHGDESPDLLRRYVDIVAESGNGCLTAESRPHVDWLEKGWFRDLAILLDQAKKHDMKLWIFDEKWWPSGEVGGRVPEKYASKYLKVAVREANGTGDAIIHGGKHHVATLLGKRTPEGIDGDSLVSVSWSGGRFQPKSGDWTVMNFTWEYGHYHGASEYLVDGASRDAVAWYINTVYQPHYDAFPEDFGKTIQGYFYDEPETIGDWGTEVIPMLKERGVDWKKALVAWKVGLAGEEQVAAKYAYQDAFAEAWGRTMYGGISDWCAEHGVTSIGHWLEHSWEYLRPDRCAGNMFQVQKYTDMGGIDAVFKQFVWGRRDMGIFYTPKLGSSITHAYGKKDDLAMVEIYGARGQDISYPEMKWWLDHMQVSGINFIIPHSFNPRSPRDRDCPPYFFNGGYEPRYPLYKVWADYSVRLSHMLYGGKHVCPVAFLFLGNSHHVGESVPPEQMTGALQDALFDCDWIPYEVLEKDMTIVDRTLALRDERYRVLVVPPVEVIPFETLVRVKAFYDAGGVVAGYGFLPVKSATLGYDSQDIAALREAIWGVPRGPSLAACNTNAAGGRAYLLPKEPAPDQVWKALAGDARVRPTVEVLDGETNRWLHVLHRVKEDRDVFFITNQNIDGGPRIFRLKVRAGGTPECWDPMRGEVRAVEHQATPDGTILSLTLEENEGVLLVFGEKDRDLPMRDVLNVRATLPVERYPSLPSSSPDIDALLKGAGEEPLWGASWIWHAADGAMPPPGTRYFHRVLKLPVHAVIAEARFKLSADNSCVLFVNGREAGSGSRWDRPVELDITADLKPGVNHITIRATNGATYPNPAGVIGRLTVRLEDGGTLELTTDASWKTAESGDTHEASWAPAVVLGDFGIPPWGNISNTGLTLPPVRMADPFDGMVTVPEAWLGTGRVHVAVGAMSPEEGARITVNGVYAGGFIGKPYRLDVTDFLKPGENDIRVEPFAPESVALVWEQP